MYSMCVFLLSCELRPRRRSAAVCVCVDDGSSRKHSCWDFPTEHENIWNICLSSDANSTANPTDNMPVLTIFQDNSIEFYTKSVLAIFYESHMIQLCTKYDWGLVFLEEVWHQIKKIFAAEEIWTHNIHVLFEAFRNSVLLWTKQNNFLAVRGEKKDLVLLRFNRLCNCMQKKKGDLRD